MGWFVSLERLALDDLACGDDGYFFFEDGRIGLVYD